MIKSKFLITILSITTLAICLTSCNSCNQRAKDYEFVEVDRIDFDMQNIKFTMLAKGAVWDTWKKLHKQCMVNSFFKNQLT